MFGSLLGAFPSKGKYFGSPTSVEENIKPMRHELFLLIVRLNQWKVKRRDTQFMFVIDYLYVLC